MVKKCLLLSFLLILSLSFISAYLSTDNSSSVCVEKWACDDWSSCYYGEKERDCWDENLCGTTIYKPEEKRSCYYRDYRYDDCYDGYYSMHSGCLRIDRTYYDDYQLELMNYYRDKYETPQKNKQQEQPIQVINLKYPEDNKDKYRENLGIGFYLNAWLIGVILLGFLTLILFVLIIVIAMRR